MKTSPAMFWVVLACVTGSQATPVVMQIGPGGSFNVNYKLSTGQSTAATLQISGDLSGDVEISNGIISSFRFRGGNVAYSDTTSNIIISTFPGTTKVTLLTRNVVSSAVSQGGAGSIDPLTGIISNSGHLLIQDRGTVTTRYYVASVLTQEEIRNLSTNPDSNPLVGVTTVTGSLLQNLGYKERYQIGFNHTRDENRTEPAPFVSGTLNIREAGGFNAAGEVWVPGQAFASWAMAERGQRPETLVDLCATTGQPLVMLYAFDAGSGPWSPPVTFDTTAGRIHLNLPASGLKAPVRLEFSTSLASGGWALLTRDDETPSIFDTGESGPVAMDMPSGPGGFVRLALAE